MSYIDVVSERAQYWLGVAAQPSEAVAATLKITGDWQTFQGLPGTEGTLRVAGPKRDKTEIFNEALKDAAHQPKGDAVTKKSEEKAEEKAAEPAKVPASETPEGAAEEGEAAEEITAENAGKSEA